MGAPTNAGAVSEIEASSPRISIVDWLPAIAVAALIFTMSTFHGDELPAIDTGLGDLLPPWLVERLDKVAHFTVYAALGAACHRALRRRIPSRLALGLTVLVCAAYGVSDEWHQVYVPGRSPDVLDWLADVSGSLVGAALFAGIMRRKALRAPR